MKRVYALAVVVAAIALAMITGGAAYATGTGATAGPTPSSEITISLIPSTQPSASKSPAASAKPSPASPSPAGGLPVTGAPTALIAIMGAGALLAGVGLVVIGRRRIIWTRR